MSNNQNQNVSNNPNTPNSNPNQPTHPEVNLSQSELNELGLTQSELDQLIQRAQSERDDSEAGEEGPVRMIISGSSHAIQDAMTELRKIGYADYSEWEQPVATGRPEDMQMRVAITKTVEPTEHEED